MYLYIFRVNKNFCVKSEQEIHNEQHGKNKQSQPQLQSPKTFKSPKNNLFTSKRLKPAHSNTPIVNEAVHLMWSISFNRLEKDGYSLFGEQITIKMRKLLPPYARFVVRNAINNILFEAETGKFDSPININLHLQHASLYGIIPPPSFNSLQFNLITTTSSNHSSMNRFIPSPCASSTSQSESHYLDNSSRDTCMSETTGNEDITFSNQADFDNFLISL